MAQVVPMSANVIVTGGAGYIGSHACKALSRHGFLPVTIDNLSAGRGDAVRWGPLEVGDLLDPARLQEVFHQYRPVAVMHFAACALVEESMAEPARYWRNNLIGTVNLLDVCRIHSVRAFILSSTCAVYGNASLALISEDAPKVPVNPYGSSKLAAEMALHGYCSAYGLCGAVLRYFNAAGADPEGELGEHRPVETHLIPRALDAALGTGPALQVMGTDYPTPDGTAVRDYIHVSDLADGHVAALQHLLNGGEACSLNLGTGRGHSVSEVLEAVQRITGLRVPCEIAPRRPGDPPQLIANASRARGMLRLAFPLSDGLDRIIASAWQWRRKFAAAQYDA